MPLDSLHVFTHLPRSRIILHRPIFETDLKASLSFLDPAFPTRNVGFMLTAAATTLSSILELRRMEKKARGSEGRQTGERTLYPMTIVVLPWSLSLSGLVSSSCSWSRLDMLDKQKVQKKAGRQQEGHNKRTPSGQPNE
jgi:hypothetical protein